MAQNALAVRGREPRRGRAFFFTTRDGIVAVGVRRGMAAPQGVVPMRRSSFWSYESRLLVLLTIGVGVTIRDRVALTTLAIPGCSTFDRVCNEDSVLHGRA